MINSKQSKYIFENYPKLSPTEIANNLGIHMMKVSVYINKMKKSGLLTKEYRRKLSKRDEIYICEKLSEAIGGKSDLKNHLANKFKVSYDTIDNIYRRKRKNLT